MSLYTDGKKRHETKGADATATDRVPESAFLPSAADSAVRKSLTVLSTVTKKTSPLSGKKQFKTSSPLPDEKKSVSDVRENEVHQQNFFKAADECRRMLLKSSALVGNGRYREGVSLLCKTFRLAEDKELYAEQISAFEMMMVSALRNGKIPEYPAEKLAHGLRMLGELTTSQSLYFQSRQPLLYGNYPETTDLQEWEIKAGLLRGFLDHYPSERISFYFHYHCLHLAYHKKNGDAILTHARQLKSFISQSHIYQAKEKLFYPALVHEAAGLLSVGQRKEAMEICGNFSEQNITKYLKDDLFAMEKLFVCSIELNLPSLSCSLLKMAELSEQIRETPTLNQKWTYLNGIRKLSNGEFENARSIFTKCLPVSKKRSRCEAFISIMNIICSVEMGCTDSLMMKSEALQKFFYRYYCEFKSADIRFANIIWVMKSLIRYDFDFNRTAQKEKQRLLLLKKDSFPGQWFPSGTEVVRFDKWFRAQWAKQDGKIRKR